MDEKIKELMYNLSMELLKASEAYYNGMQSGLSDADYDNKLQLLAALERKYPQYKLGGEGSGLVSPTEQVGSKPIGSLEKVEFDTKQLSLDKRYSIEEVIDFIGDNYPVTGSYKADGLTIVCDYNEILKDAVTRGDGFEGFRVLHTVRYSDVPAAIPFKGKLKVRCEAVIPCNKFQELVNEAEEKGEKPPKTARNLVAGTVRCLEPSIARDRGVELHPFELISADFGDRYRVYQLPIEDSLCFRSYEEWVDHRMVPKAEYYNEVYTGIIEPDTDLNENNNHLKFLNDLFRKLNLDHPGDYKARSLSVSDVVVLDLFENGEYISYAYFVDGLGFKRIQFECSPAYEMLESDFKRRQFLEEQGFSCVPYRLLRCEEEVRQYYEEVTALRESGCLDYDIDGIVFAIDNIAKRRELGCTSTHPLYSVAFKYPNKGKVSTVSNITWQSGMFGLTPVITVSPPVSIGGVTISKATAHNLSFLLGKNDQGVIVRPPIRADGSTEVEILRAGEVIPKIGNVFFNSDCEVIVDYDTLYPKVCECGSPTIVSGVDLLCTNPSCPGKLKARLINMASRDCLDIEGFGEKTVNMLVDKGIVRNLQDIFQIDEYRNEIIQMEGYGPKKVEKLLKEIRATANAPLHKVIASLPIKGVGLETARAISTVLPDGLSDLLSITKDDLREIEGVGDITAANIVEFVAQSKDLIYCYLYNGIGLASDRKEGESKSNILANKTFVVTGTLFDDRATVEDLIRRNGGRVVSALSRKVDFLVVGENPGKSKLDAAEQHSVEQISGDELLKMINM